MVLKIMFNEVWDILNAMFMYSKFLMLFVFKLT